MKRQTKHIFALVLIVVSGAALLHPATAVAQDIAEIGKSDPLIVTGSVGTRNTYFHSNHGVSYASPLSNSVYANMNISIYGFSMPFSLYYTNDNLDFNYPHISFNIAPKYKQWTAYFGENVMPFSPYVLNMAFTGAGIEYGGKKFRAGIFYGKLRSAVNDSPYDVSPRLPQYRRMAMGFKVGYGSDRNYVDLYVLRGWDSKRSIDPVWAENLYPEECLTIGLKGGVSIKKFLSFTTNFAVSIFSKDVTSDKINSDVTKKYETFYPIRYSTLARMAGDVSLNLSLKGINASVFYRLVQPDYTSLGTYYLTNNYHSLGLSANTFLFRKISLSGSFSAQADNLTKEQLYTTKGFVFNANVSSSIGKHFFASLSYNGFLQNQGDGTMKVDESTRVNRLTQSITATPNYNTDTEHFTHSVSLSGSLIQNKDLNSSSIGQTDVTALAGGLSYSLGVKSWEVDFIAALNHQQSQGYNTKYTSDLASLTVSRSFLKEKNLSLSLTGNFVYNSIERQSKSASMGLDLSVAYTLKKLHAFSASFGANRYGDVNQAVTHSRLDNIDISASFNYTYTFTLWEIKRKAERK